MVIKCKEDLERKYALRSDTEVFELFMQKCEEFGIAWKHGEPPRYWFNCSVDSNDCVFYSIDGHLRSLMAEPIKPAGCKKLTVADFTQPVKTKTEYIKTDKEIWDLQEEFKAGLVYWDFRDDVGLIKADERTRLRVLFRHDLYIKTEVEIPWHERLDDFSYPLAIFESKGGVCSFSKKELKGLGQYYDSMRPATKAEIQVLLNNALE